MAVRPIVIAAPSADCGKTALAVRLVQALPGAQALKITRFHREEHCPVHGAHGNDCDGCDPVPAGYQLVDDPAVLATPGKDTDRLSRAGASPVLWLRAAPHTFEYALGVALKRFDSGRPLVMEGNSAATVSSLQAVVVVIWPQHPRGVKASVLPALRRCDALVLVEAEDGTARRRPASLEAACRRAGVEMHTLPAPIWLPTKWWETAAGNALTELIARVNVDCVRERIHK